MAVIRINPTAPLSQIRQVGVDLKRVVADAGPLSAAPHLLRRLDEVDAACANSAPLPVEVWTEDGTDADAAARWLLGEAPTSWSDAPHGRRARRTIRANA